MHQGNSDQFIPGRSFDHFKLEASVGYTSTRKTFRAQDIAARRPVQLTLMPLNNMSSLERSQIYAALAQLLSFHAPGVAPLYEFGHSEGVGYFAEAWVDAHPYADLLTKRLMSAHEVLTLFEPLAATLDQAHDHGLYHGALSDQTVLIRHNTNVLCVSQFGLAHETLLEIGQRVDENRLQPLPAALRAREQGMLARLFYRTVVGANAHVDTVASYAELTPVHVLNPGLPSALDSVLARAWSGRYPVCADFLAAVRSALTRAVDATSNELDAQLRTSTPPLTQSRGTALPGILLIIALGVLFALIGIAIANASAWIIEPDGLAAFFRRGDTRAAGALNDRRADVAGRQNPLMGWSMVNGNAQRTNASDARLPAVRRALWRRDLRPDGPVLVGDGLLILRIQDRLLALDLLNGVNVWERALPNLLNLPDALALTQGPERMIIAADRESLQAIDLRTGQTRWRMTSASAPARVLVDEEAILAVTGDGTLYAYAPEDGQLLWIMRDSALPRRIAQPLVSDGAVLALLGDDGRIHVVDLRERRLRWSAVLESTAVASPVLGASSGLLFTPMPSGELRAYALHDGALIWQKQTCAAIRGLALANGRLLAACNDGVLAALGTTRGEIIWRTSTGTTALSAPVTDGALVSVASQIAIAGKAALRFFDIRSGADLPGRSMTLAPARTTLVNSGRVLIVQSSGIEALVD